MTATGRDDKRSSDRPKQLSPDVATFLGALFAPEEIILLRPTEVWIEAGKKRSRVIYKAERYLRPCDLARRPDRWHSLLDVAEQEHANLFFGVCPRFGDGGRFDLAAQVRVVRVLWADLDDCTPKEALKRCEAAGLPRPSIIVCSGNGVHLYWLLAEPYLIDDMPDPLPVFKEFIEQGGDKKLVRKYVIGPDEERVYQYLDAGNKRRNHDPVFPSDLSDKAQHVQHVLKGLATAAGGDHTTDLARLLRLPGTFNRKDERNGREPRPCVLFECDPTRRYPFSLFEPHADASPDLVKERAASKIKLKVGVRLTNSRRNNLLDRINRCATAEIGARSGHDWSLVCYCIEEGYDKEQIWAEVQEAGKFGERGRTYFDLTWAKAEKHTRLRLYERSVGANTTAHRRSATSPPTASGAERNGTCGGTPAPPEEGGGTEEGAVHEDGPQEAITDPHRLARCYREQRAAHPDRCTLTFFQEFFWSWNGSRWRMLSDKEMEAAVNSFCKEQLDRDVLAIQEETWDGEDAPPAVPPVTATMVRDVLLALRATTIVKPYGTAQPVWLGDQPGPRNWIALGNGILDVEAWLDGKANALRPHSPLWFSPVCLPYDFQPGAGCPTLEKVLARNLVNDTGKPLLLQQFVGYLLLPDLQQQQYLEMHGEGNNGKSVLCAMITALLGEENVSTVPLELFSDKFRLVGTLGKLANITAEVGELDKIAEGQLKSFVAGDLMEFERKFKQPFSARPTARLVLATNNPPQFSDKSDGIFRRRIPLPFTVQIPEEEKVKGMDKVEFWQQSGELPGILNWALRGLHSLRLAKQFTIPHACRVASEQLRQDSNPARRFLQERYKVGPGCGTPTAWVYEEYREWCAATGHRPLADNTFGKEVVRAFKEVKPGKVMVSEDRDGKPLEGEHGEAQKLRVNGYPGLIHKKEGED
jgi:P4 family phage/plasmid primase-like protien